MTTSIAGQGPHERPVVPHAPTPRAKRAYTVREDGEGHCVVVFATSGAEARRLGGYKLDLSFEEVDSCVRAPEFDAYADTGKVPPLVAIAHGWWFECDYCGHKVDEDAEGPDGEELHPVADGQRVYCNASHLMDKWVDVSRVTPSPRRHPNREKQEKKKYRESYFDVYFFYFLYYNIIIESEMISVIHRLQKSGHMATEKPNRRNSNGKE